MIPARNLTGVRRLVALLTVFFTSAFALAEVGGLAPLILTNGVPQDLFGMTVAVDSQFLFVGAPGANGLKGEVHVFKREPLDPNSWSHQQVLRPVSAKASLLFGNSLSYDHNGRLAVAGNHGPVFIFTRSPAGFSQEAEIADAEDNDIGPQTISLTEGLLAVGNTGDGPDEQGSVHLYANGASGWQLKTKLQADQPVAGALFGTAVYLTYYTMVVGAPGENNGTGAVYAFERDGDTWVQRQKFTPTNPEPNLWFGESVATTHEFIVIGAPGDGVESSTPGRAFLYEYDFQGPLQYHLVKELIPAEQLAPRSRYGIAVAVSDHQAVVNQLPESNVMELQVPGAAHVFTQKLEGWEERLRLSRPGAQIGDAFGGSVAIFNDSLVIGDYGNSVKPGTAHYYNAAIPLMPPVFLDAPEDQQIGAAPGQPATATFEATIGDNNGNDLNATWKVDGVQVQRDFLDSSGRFTFGTVSLTTTLEPGVHEISILAEKVSYEGSATHQFTVTVGDFTGPVIQSITVDPSVARSQHGRFFRAKVNVHATDPSGSVSWRIVSVASSDPTDTRPHRLPDWRIPGRASMAVLLRAITTDPKVDRVYTIHVEVSDSAGNITPAEVTVTITAAQNAQKPKRRR